MLQTQNNFYRKMAKNSMILISLNVNDLNVSINKDSVTGWIRKLIRLPYIAYKNLDSKSK